MGEHNWIRKTVFNVNEVRELGIYLENLKKMAWVCTRCNVTVSWPHEPPPGLIIRVFAGKKSFNDLTCEDKIVENIQSS
jgi:hypothetical protein